MTARPVARLIYAIGYVWYRLKRRKIGLRILWGNPVLPGDRPSRGESNLPNSLPTSRFEAVLAECSVV